MPNPHLITPWQGSLRVATLVGRPHRFRIDARFRNHRLSGVHCVNPGRGEALMRLGAPIWVSRSPTKSRDLRWTWMLTRKHGTFVGTNSVVANELVHQLLLRRLVRQGHRASVFVVVQRGDVRAVRPSELHDPDFCRELRQAVSDGVEARAFSFRPSPRGFNFLGEIAVDLARYSPDEVRRWSQQNARHSGWNHWNSNKAISD